MANTYIIELFTWKNTESVYEKKDDCLMILNLSGKQMGYLTIKSDNKELEYMTVDILNENLVILSREKHNVMSMWNVINNSQVIDYEMYYNGTKFGIRFDTRSSAAEKNFLTEFNKLRKAVQTDDGYNGYCIEYYDNVNSPIKYMGEFEDGEYDGVGEFFSEDSNIRLICGTICNGVPNGHGKLIIGKNKIVQNVDMKKIKYLANSPSYTNQICMDLFPEYNDLIEQVNFEAMGSVDDKLIYLLKKLQMLSSTNMKKTQKDIGTFDSVTKTLSHMFSN
jgi:hypothetical protein